jgi:hypothetical protein
MIEELDRLEGAFDRLQDQYAALRQDIEKTIAALQGMIEEEE